MLSLRKGKCLSAGSWIPDLGGRDTAGRLLPKAVKMAEGMNGM